MLAVMKTNDRRGVEIAEIEKPAPAGDEVLVRVEAASICGSDLHMYESLHGYGWITLPLVLGHEFCGIVEQAGGEAGEALVGKRVLINPYVPCGVCYNCRRGNTNLCDYGLDAMAKVPAKSLKYGFRENGGMAGYAAVKTSNVLPLPEGLSAETAAILEAVGIGVRAIERSNVKPGDRVVVIGPGPIGLSLAASLSNLGLAELIVTGLRKDEQRLRLALELGATRVVYADEIDDVEAIRCITGGQGVDHVFDTSGFHASAVSAARMCVKGGEVLLVGICPQPSTIPTSEIVRGEVTLKGVYGVTEQTLRRTIAMAASGKYGYEKLVTHVYPLDQAVEGFEAGLAKQAVKVVLVP
jgi:threonine dehydrogenase-like Zn-dependent dehydrogenase